MKTTGLHKHLWLLIAMKEKIESSDYIKILNFYITRHHKRGQKINENVGENT